MAQLRRENIRVQERFMATKSPSPPRQRSLSESSGDGSTSSPYAPRETYCVPRSQFWQASPSKIVCHYQSGGDDSTSHPTSPLENESISESQNIHASPIKQLHLSSPPSMIAPHTPSHPLRTIRSLEIKAYMPLRTKITPQ